MDVDTFVWSSRRAQYARYGKAIRSWVLFLDILVIVLLALGAGSLFVGMALGWLMVGFAAVPAVISQWFRAELSDLPTDKSSRTIHGRAETEFLSHLPKNPTPKQLAYVLMQVNGGIFFEVRLGIGGSFFKEVSSDDPKDTAAIFEEALTISDKLDGVISPGVIILAMVRQLPMRETLLGHLQLDEEDLLRGIEWYHYLVSESKLASGRKFRSGGVGRDWSFGWIPVLSHFGTNISQSRSRPRGEVRTELIDQIVASLSGSGGTTALIGRDGVGKTEVVYELASRLINPSNDLPKDLWYQQIFMLDAARLLSVASGKGQLESLVTNLLGEAYAAKNIILCLDNADLFFEEGVGSVDITSLLLPIVEAGRMRLILTLDEQRFLQVSKRVPGLVGPMTRIVIQPTDEAATLKVLEDHLPVVEHRRKVTYMYQALKESYRLSQRYIYDVSMPGQAITLMDQAAEYAENKLVTARSVSRAIENMTGVKTGLTEGTEEREMLLNLESLLHQRMIGQDRAVNVVADALRRARAGVRNVSRPVGTFLFLGPTGVGKTELAKSLASVYFGGEQNIIRLDMNEFVSPDDVKRLIADGAEDPGSLTAQVMKQPFSVVLLDELEKAHSTVLTTLLQLLDEGVLRDVRGREISFRDTVVIATSNAGADRIREYIERGYNLAQFEETFLNELISSKLFHPEFLNRFDEIVVFAPLTKPELLQVVDLILADVNKNLATQKISIVVDSDAKEYLVEAGYDPRLGARPMRRVVQRAVESTVAKLLLSNEATPGSEIVITRQQVEEILASRSQAEQIASDTTGLAG